MFPDHAKNQINPLELGTRVQTNTRIRPNKFLKPRHSNNFHVSFYRYHQVTAVCAITSDLNDKEKTQQIHSASHEKCMWWSSDEKQTDASLTVPRLLQLCVVGGCSDCPKNLHCWLRDFMNKNKKQIDSGIQKGLKTMMGIQKHKTTMPMEPHDKHANIMGTAMSEGQYQLPAFFNSAPMDMYFMRLAEVGLE